MPKPLPFDIESCELVASKHFRNKYMRLWDWDYLALREAIKNAHRLEKVGKTKFEAYCRERGKSKKIIFVYYPEFNSLFVISGSEGGGEK
jgi:hypothetical protein